MAEFSLLGNNNPNVSTELMIFYRVDNCFCSRATVRSEKAERGFWVHN